MPESSSVRWHWRIGALHAFVGIAILFLTLHPLRDALDQHRLVLAQTGSAVQALSGIGLLWLCSRPQSRVAAWLIAAGTTVFTAMLYLLVFVGDQPLEAMVPVGGMIMLAGWAKLLFERP